MFSRRANIIAILIVSLLALGLKIGKAEECIPRSFGYGSIVCVCNSTYCDSAAKIVPETGQYRSYESGKDGKRMSQTVGRFNDNLRNDNEIETVPIILNYNKTFQTIHGFGGAFTDSAGININKLSGGCQDRIIDTYFGVNGSRYNIGRVPIGGTDFSTRGYTYDDSKEPDPKLEKFALAEEDLIYKIPLMQKALAMSPSLKFTSAVWSPPIWMKTNDDFSGFGFLKKEYYQTYADYIVKFLVEYKGYGLTIEAVSTGNEPTNAYLPLQRISTLGWTPKNMADWMADHLGPTIENSESSETTILIVDDDRPVLSWYAGEIFKNPRAKNYTAGIAVHWYFDSFVSPDVLDAVQAMFPDKYLIITEACVGSSIADQPKVRLGDWERGEKYILNIIQNFEHWMTGWVDWNFALDKNGGPNWIENFVDAAIIVNPETDEFFKQPTYYALAHFSKFIDRHSTRIETTNNPLVENVAFLTPDNEIVIVLHNGHDDAKAVTVIDPVQGNISITLSPRTVMTIIYKN